MQALRAVLLIAQTRCTIELRGNALALKESLCVRNEEHTTGGLRKAC